MEDENLNDHGVTVSPEGTRGDSCQSCGPDCRHAQGLNEPYAEGWIQCDHPLNIVGARMVRRSADCGRFRPNERPTE